MVPPRARQKTKNQSISTSTSTAAVVVQYYLLGGVRVVQVDGVVVPGEGSKGLHVLGPEGVLQLHVHAHLHGHALVLGLFSQGKVGERRVRYGVWQDE